MFKDGRTNVSDEERSGRTSIESDDLVQSLDQQICERRSSKVRNFIFSFHKFHALFSTRLSLLG
jgi:hypothetical protein